MDTFHDMQMLKPCRDPGVKAPTFLRLILFLKD